jgi:cytochrome c oxidase subunit 1
MPRRVYTYPPGLGWDGLNLLVSIGAAVMSAGLAAYLFNVVISLRAPATAPADPWNGESLEWATASPPPPYNFLPAPAVSGRSPMWESPETRPIVGGLRADRREVLITSVMDAEPDHRKTFPEPSVWPFVTALAVAITYLGSIFTPWAVVYGALPIGAALVGWLYPRGRGKAPEDLERQIDRGDVVPLEQVQ